MALGCLADGSCSMAVVIGVNTLVSPFVLSSMQQVGALSPTGTSAPFDARGDGFCRAEGAVAVVLMPPRHASAVLPATLAPTVPAGALRAYARVLGSSSSHIGRQANPTLPSAAAQQRLVECVHAHCGVKSHKGRLIIKTSQGSSSCIAGVAAGGWPLLGSVTPTCPHYPMQSWSHQLHMRPHAWVCPPPGQLAIREGHT